MSGSTVVIGGGLVGLAVAYGLGRLGVETLVLDEGDVAHRATRGNFGLIWVQNKGGALPAYAAWSRDAAARWPRLAADLMADTGVDVALQQPGGFCFCHDEQEMESRRDSLSAIAASVSGPYPFEMLGHAELKRRLPAIGPAVAGASLTPMDGHVNPLLLYRALDEAARLHGVHTRREAKVHSIRFDGTAFHLVTSIGTYKAGKVVLAAGLGNRHLAQQVGLHAPVEPIRGQVIVTERVRPFLHHPTNKLRQTAEGSIQIGDTVEDVGFDEGTTTKGLRFMASRAVRTFPLLRDVNVIRTWGSLRVMTPDGFPIYEQSATCPGAFVATCHSGVTLAATHALEVAPWIAGGPAPAGIEVFSSARLHCGQQAPRYVN